MRTIMIAVVVATIGTGCSKKEEPGSIPVTINADATTLSRRCPECAECPEQESCPECKTVDAVYYSMLHRIERGRPESYVSTAHVHRGGRWFRVANVFPDGMEGPDAAPVPDFAVGDALLDHVRAHPTDVGVKTIAGDDYAQRGRVLASWQPFDRIEDAPGIRASLASVFVLLE